MKQKQSKNDFSEDILKSRLDHMEELNKLQKEKDQLERERIQMQVTYERKIEQLNKEAN